ncbi:MAG: NUDIX domain-containing protein [Flavobacteriaceae bacterium]|nr:NUDIX domain-containing protein [Muriicola sp.]NNC62653.1 NUDIX domain-containing protein [Eudoraea sp.]NNK19967.1 NUDIX domain-containing protein [Flavobacteriaceae bacterium]NNL39274.1 NUDIX domain-containing protein [Flavobacteriaceae bacterium]
MDEWVDVLDSDGRYTGQKILKSEAHKKGLFHPTVHIWFYSEKGEILLQQRAEIKKTFPLFWDVSVAGHVAAGETIEKSAIREVREEIGLDITDKELVPVGVFKSIQQHHSDLLDCEFHHTFICLLIPPLDALEKQKEEVEALQLMPLKVWEKDLFSATPTLSYVPHEAVYYKEVITAIKKRL